MKITVLLENAPRPGFKAEHGLSLLLSLPGQEILFDMGQSDAFARNADRLGIELSALSFAVLSHGHYDHGGGIPEFLSRSSHAPVYLSSHCFRNFCRGTKFIGLPPSLSREPRLRRVCRDTDLSPGITLRCCQELVQIVPPEQDGLLAEGIPDDFRHELCLEIREAGKKILISGCSHSGIENLLHRFRPQVFVGGLHTRNMDVAGPAFSRLAAALDASQATFYTGHCTGKPQFDALKQRLGDRIQYLYTGSAFTL